MTTTLKVIPLLVVGFADAAAAQNTTAALASRGRVAVASTRHSRRGANDSYRFTRIVWNEATVNGTSPIRTR
jgi:hypothetical protein